MSMWAPAPEPSTELGRYRILCPSAGIRVSPLQLGAMSIGSAWSEFMGSMDKEKSFELLDAYFDAGGNFIDTANNYQDEESERWIGEWITARQNRDRLVLATKYTTDYKSHEHGKGKVVNFCGNHKKSLHMSLRDSLDKLQTDYIDILYLHWWDWTTSIEEVILDQKELDFAILGRICTFETCCRSSYGSSANVLFWNKVQGAFCLIASFV